MLDKLSFYSGIVPFQIYTIPGLLVSILQFFLSNDDTNVRVHILPQLISFSLINLIKSSIGNYNQKMIPSGKLCVAFTLFITLICELTYHKQPKLFTFNVRDDLKKYIQIFVISVVLLLTYNVYVHKKNNISSLILSIILGTFIGLITWKNMYNSIDDKDKETDILRKNDLISDETSMNYIRIFLVINIVLLIFYHMKTIIKIIPSLK
jgi:hypothetical protein